jgi:hypothetical protein
MKELDKSLLKQKLRVLIDKEFQDIDQVFIPIFKSDDSFLIDYAQKLIYNNNSKSPFWM